MRLGGAGRRGVAVGALVGGLAAAVLVTVPGPAAAAPTGDDCTGINQTDIEEKKPPTGRSAPLQEMQVAEAQRIVARRTGVDAEEAGAGVRVAVVDSGVATDGVTVVDRLRDGEMKSYRGTAMAGIIAGAPEPGDIGIIGVAPGAEIVDARFFDAISTNPDDGEPPSVANLVDGLRALLPEVGRGRDDVRIVNVSIATETDDDRLRAVVDDLTDRGAIVVASSGNRVSETQAAQDDDQEAEAYESGEDEARYPAAYSADNPLVVSVGTTVDATEDADAPPGLLSSSIDVVVPTLGAVSYSINGSTCSFYGSSTSVAAAEVSGVLALLTAAFPDDTPAQLVTRLEDTATGGQPSRTGLVDKFRGRGIVQPVEALTRPLRPARDGSIDSGRQEPVAAPPAALPPSEPDVLRGTRRNAVWWGLFGGGALVVALLMRPVLSRRR